jgi:RNA polymerase sigma-70 factor (ECF subfamily)
MLYSRYARRMYALCMRYTRNEAEAQDVMQDGWVCVFAKMGGFREEGSLEGWIRRIMVHTAINHYRRRAHREERLGPDRMPQGSVPETATGSMNEKDLLAMVASLPDGYRHVFNLYAIEGYDHAEIAELLGCGESTSRSQLAKARRWLQQRLHELTPEYNHGRPPDR